ncbi:MAG: hypothetical protein RMJ84_06960 [Sandaracinaceae bacterium]|nr:hypothetical protein [Sandaracinaceae bacterium]
MFQRRLLVVVGLLASAMGCGAGTSQRVGGGREAQPKASECEVRLMEQEEAATHLAHCMARRVPWAHEELHDEAMRRVRRLQELALPIPIEEAQRASAALMDLIDALTEEVRWHPLYERAEIAAEALLRERAGERARNASIEAERTLEEIRSAFAPPNPCEEAERALEKARRAAKTCAMTN